MYTKCQYILQNYFVLVAKKRKKREPKKLRCHAKLEPDPNIKPAWV